MPRRAATVRGLPMNSEKLTNLSCGSLLHRRLRKNAGFHGIQHRPMNFLGRIQYAGSQVGTDDAHPVWFGCQAVINSGGLFEMGYVCFLNIMSMRSVGARGFQADEAKRLWRGDAQIHNQVLDWQAIDAVLDILQPGEKFVAFVGRDAFRLVRQIRANVPVGENNFSRGQSRFDLAFCFKPVTGVKDGRELRVHGFERAEITVEIAPGEFAEGRIIARESDAHDGSSPRLKRMREQIQLCAFARAVDSFERDQFSAWRHELVVSLTCAWRCRKEVPRALRVSPVRVLEFAR